MLTIVSSVIGIIFVLVGSVWLYFNLFLHVINEAEVEMMKENGKFEGDPDWMQEFNIAQSELDLQTNERNRYLSVAVIAIGILILSSLAIKAWLL